MLPQLGESVTEGTITRWFKSVGDTVTEDEPLFEVSTDKVDTEVPSPASGVLDEIRVEEGETVDVGTVLAVLGEGDDRTRRFGSLDETGRIGAGPGCDPNRPPNRLLPPLRRSQNQRHRPHQLRNADPRQLRNPRPSSPTGSSTAGSGKLLSPLVRRLVDEHGLDPDAIAGTGVGGRITREDVLDAVDTAAVQSQPRPSPSPPSVSARGPVSAHGVESQPAVRPRPEVRVAPMRPGEGDEVEPLNRIRRMTGDLMVASKAASPHVISMMEVDYSAIEAARLPRTR